MRWILASASAAVRSRTRRSSSAWVRRRFSSLAPAHRHVGGERQARHRQADHEGEQQQEGFVDADLPERAGMLERRPDGKAGEDQATLAVSRGPRRSAAQTSGRIARKPSGLVYSARGSSGLKAMRPTHGVTASTAMSHQLAALEVAPLGPRPQHDRRRHHQRAGGVAQPPGDPDRREIRPGRKARHASVVTPTLALMTVAGPTLTSANFATRAGVAKVSRAARPAPDQKAAGDRLQRVAERR